jgi:hypothetical protein
MGLLVASVQAQPVVQPFTFSLLPHTLPQVRQGALLWGDYDADGDLDVLLSGRDDPQQIVTGLYRNDGRTALIPGDSLQVFTLVQALSPVVYSRAAWGDYDGDGDLDLALLGSRTLTHPYEPATFLYRNDQGTLVEVAVGLRALHSGPVAWGDYDNDGDLDLLLGGEDAAGTPHTLLYRNDQAAGFQETAIGLPGTAYGEAQWADYDRDQDLDLLLAGLGADGLATTLYRNDRAGRFATVPANLAGVAFPSLDWTDFDADGDLDLLLTGSQLFPTGLQAVTQLYTFQAGIFTPADTGLPALMAGRALWGDYDHDGDPDLLVLGALAVPGTRTGRLYRNDAGTLVLATYLPGAVLAGAEWGDLEGDGDLDLLTTGLAETNQALTNLYENRRQVVPPPPATPAGLRAESAGAQVTLTWAAPSDGTSYNLRVGSRPGGTDVVAPLATPETGHRMLARPGNTGPNTTWMLNGLTDGSYYWSVQAIDPAFQGSPFAPEGLFTIADGRVVDREAAPAVPQVLALHPSYPNPFRQATTLRYDLPRSMYIQLRVYNLLGKAVITLHDGLQPAGTHTLVWDGHDAARRPLPSGHYFYELRAGTHRQTGTLTLIR